MQHIIKHNIRILSITLFVVLGLCVVPSAHAESPSATVLPNASAHVSSNTTSATADVQTPTSAVVTQFASVPLENTTLSVADYAIVTVIQTPYASRFGNASCHCSKEKSQVPPASGGIPVTTTTASATSTTPLSSTLTTLPHTLSIRSIFVTGSNIRVLALFGNIMMLFLYAYLRLRSGRSPGQAILLYTKRARLSGFFCVSGAN